MKQHLRTAAIVTLVAAMIWVFAEGASLQRRTRRAELVWVAMPASGRSVRVADPDWTGSVDVVLDGSAAALDRLESLWLEPVLVEPGQEGVPTAPGEHVIDLREVLRARPELRDSGASVVRCDPPTVRIETDEMVEATAGVVVELPETEPDAEAIPSVESVVVRLPRRRLEALDAPMQVVARIDPAALRGAVRGRPENVRRVRLDPLAPLSGVEGAVIEPARIDVSVTLRTRTASVVLATVPVVVELSPLDQARWNVSIPPEDQVLRNVRVSGPADLVGAIERGETRVSAFVPLSFEDLEGAVTSKRAEFTRLPSSLTFEVEDRVVTLTITARE